MVFFLKNNIFHVLYDVPSKQIIAIIFKKIAIIIEIIAIIYSDKYLLVSEFMLIFAPLKL